MDNTPFAYRFYPTLLDRYQELLDSAKEAEGEWNMDPETGLPYYSAEELTRRNEQALLDTINRVPQEPCYEADRGSCFNEAVDRMIKGGSWGRNDIVVDFGFLSEDGEFVCDSDFHSPDIVRTNMDGFTFLFDGRECRNAADHYGKDVLCQKFCKASISTDMGLVELYGFPDEITPGKVSDIKTCECYTEGDYARSWQKEVYPYCIRESGMMDEVKEFEFTIFLVDDSKDGSVIHTRQYVETYPYDHEATTSRLKGFLNQFIGWLEAHRDQITDRRIFGG